MKLLKFLFALLLFVSLSNAQWKGFVAQQSDADVTETEAEALDELADAIDGISAAEAVNIMDYAEAPGADAISLLTEAEAGYLDGASIANSAASKAVVLNAGGDVVTASNIGASPVGTCVATEYGDGYHHVTVLTLTDFIIGATNGAVTLAIGNIIYELPAAGVQVISVMEYNIALTVGTVQSDTPEIGIGSAIGTGATATLDNGTMEDYILSNAWGTTLDGAAAEVLGPVAPGAGVFTGIALNKTGDEKSIYLNAADTWTVSITGNLTATGTIKIVWTTIN